MLKTDLVPMTVSGAWSCVSLRRGIAVLCGVDIDQAGVAGLASVPPDWQQRRWERDGDGFHVTFLTKAELQCAAERLRDRGSEALARLEVLGLPRPDPDDLECVVRAAAALAGAHSNRLIWVDVGEGRAQDDGGESVFRVVLWPGGAAARRLLGLPPQGFHITLGFRGRDVHGKSKGVSSLLGGAPVAAAVPRLAAEAMHLIELSATADMDAEGVEQLAEAALSGADAHGDNVSEAIANRALCLLHGRLKRPERALAHADRLLQFCCNDEVGLRGRAFALVMLERYAEAMPALELARAALSQLPESERSVVEARLSQAVGICRKRADQAFSKFHGVGSGKTKSRSHSRDEVAHDSDFERAFLEERKLKFPSTPHIKDLGAATRGDKHLEATSMRLFIGSGRNVVVEEKIDGANLGISLDSNYQPRLQGRSKWVNWETDTMFRGLEEWLQHYSSVLCEVLERNRDILFGEWCAYRHTVEYTGLPGYFLAFDIYDWRVGRFLSRRSFHARLRKSSSPKIPAIPVVVCSQFGSVNEVEALLSKQSRFGNCPLEGVYLRVDEETTSNGSVETYLEDRCKLVRPEFQQAIVEGGTFRGRGKNFLDLELATTYANESHWLADSYTMMTVATNAAASTSLAPTKGLSALTAPT